MPREKRDIHLLMAQRVDGIEAGGFDCGEHSEDQADGSGEAEADGDGPAGDVRLFQLGTGNSGDRFGKPLAPEHAEAATETAEDDGFDEELEEDGAGAGADGLAEA